MNNDNSKCVCMEIIDTISSYASAYSAIEKLQSENPTIIPRGDQKTGCIGEFYAYLYLKHTNGKCSITFGNHSQKGWDISLRRNTKDSLTLIQVKTVSEYSRYKVISPIHDGWDKLFIVYLNTNLYPSGFWIINRDGFGEIPENGLKGRKCKVPGRPNTGSEMFQGSTNLVGKLVDAIDKFKKY